MNKIEEIQKLKSLLDQEAITQDEYHLLKKNILEKNDDQQTSISKPIKTIRKNGNSQSELEDATQSEQKQSSKVLTQNNINELVATTDEFWSSFHQSLALPYSNYNNYKDDSFDKWVKRVSRTPDLKSHLNILFEYVLLKGEFLIVFYQGFILTNYRLIINDESVGKPSIPLSDLKGYNAKGNGSIKYENNGEPITLNYGGFLSETYVNPAKARFKKQQLNEVQLELLSKSISELKFSNPNLEIPIIDLNPNVKDIMINVRSEYEFRNDNPISDISKKAHIQRAVRLGEKNTTKKVLSIGENFRKNKSTASWFYTGLIVMLFYIVQFGDPATYSAEIRKERAQIKHDKIDYHTATDYEMISSYNDIVDSVNNPIGWYLFYILIGGGIALVNFKKLDNM